MLHVKLFPAEYGDCIISSIGKESRYNILVDGGLPKTYHKYIKVEIQCIKELGQGIGLMVCIHMDNDYICGFIQVLKETNFNSIENTWYDGFLQIVNSRSCSQKENTFTEKNNKILDEIISQGMLLDVDQEAGIDKGMSLDVLIEERRIPLDSVVRGQTICPKSVKNKYGIVPSIFITILGPSRGSIIELEEYWKEEVVSRNYMFRVSDRRRSTEAFEYQIEHIKAIYANGCFKISENEDLMKYIGGLTGRNIMVL